MRGLSERLSVIRDHIRGGYYTVMIIGLGSVGTFLLDYLMSVGDAAMRIVVVGRSREKMEESVNIVRIASLIREQAQAQVSIEDGVDLNDVEAIRAVIEKCQPDFIVNSSRAYPGLKYGSISWASFRAYGIWAPLAIRFTKNIMQACEEADTHAVVINTSYSDAVIPWLKSAGKAYPDFGSGNLNHLVPRIRYAVAEMLGVEDYWNVDVMFAAGHFHDVVISKEGQTEGVDLPLKVWYQGDAVELDERAEAADAGGGSASAGGGVTDVRGLSKSEIFRRCAIAMPTDARRNQMNASSNLRIIRGIVGVCREGAVGGAIATGATVSDVSKFRRLFIPGAFGEIGGYPVCVGYGDSDGRNGGTDKDVVSAWIDESVFSFEEMNRANRESMYLDGIEDVRDGCLVYTDELREKVRKAFGAELPKAVAYEEIEDVAAFLIEEVIHKAGK